MNSSNLSFVAKVIGLSGGIAAFIKYALPLLLVNFPPGQNSAALSVVIVLLLAPSALMSGLFWLRRSSNS